MVQGHEWVHKIQKCLHFSHLMYKVDFTHPESSHVCDGTKTDILLFQYQIFSQEFSSKKWFFTQEIFWKTFYFFLLFNRFILKDQPWHTYSWAHLRKEAGFLNKKNLTTSIWYVIQVGRDGSFVSGTSSQRCQSSVRSLLLHRRAVLCCAPSFLYSSVKHSASNQIPNYARPFRTSGPGDGLASSPSSWCLRRWSINTALPVPAHSLTKSRQVGDVGKEALSPPLLQVDGHKVCTETKTTEGTKN